jgi:hypothetical protein
MEAPGALLALQLQDPGDRPEYPHDLGRARRIGQTWARTVPSGGEDPPGLMHDRVHRDPPGARAAVSVRGRSIFATPVFRDPRKR